MLYRRRDRDGRDGESGVALTIRGRLMVLAVVAVVPLLVDRIRALDLDRAERIEAASRQARVLARQGAAAQGEAIVSARAVLQVAASAHGLLPVPGPQCSVFLTDVADGISWLKSMSVVEPDGRVACSTIPAAVGADISGSPHIVEAMKTGEFAVSGYFVGKRVGPTILVAMPRRAADGSIDAIVTGALDLSWFGGVAAALAESSGAVVVLIDGTGTLLARQPDRDGWVGRHVADRPMVRTMLASPEGDFTGEDLDGVRRVFGFAELPGGGARIAVGFDESDLVRRVNRETLTVVAGLGVLTALILAAIWVGGERLIVAPIRLLTRTAQRVGRGDFSARATELPWAPEFVPLAVALDDMAGKLADREQELRDSNGQLRELAYIDGLTGIPNRRAFNAHLAAEWKLAAELGHPLAVLLVDVDHFKLFNDRYGHVHGDACLRAVSDVLTASTRIRTGVGKATASDMPPSFAAGRSGARNCDFAARFGGEEFAVLLQGADLDTATRVAERVRRAVEELRMVHERAPGGVVTVSIGVASLRPAEGDSAQRVVELADAGLYEAKRRGRNVVVAQPDSVLLRAS